MVIFYGSNTFSYDLHVNWLKFSLFSSRVGSITRLKRAAEMEPSSRAEFKL